jgi:hypothetical protein
MASSEFPVPDSEAVHFNWLETWHNLSKAEDGHGAAGFQPGNSAAQPRRVQEPRSVSFFLEDLSE